MKQDENNIYDMIHFSLPEQFGIEMRIGRKSYNLYPIDGRLTDGFLDNLISGADSYEFYSDERKTSKGTISFAGDSMTVTYAGTAKNYNVPFSIFRSALCRHFSKYAIYFAAPYHYGAIMKKPFDEMVCKMKKYQPQADIIVQKCSSIID